MGADLERALETLTHLVSVLIIFILVIGGLSWVALVAVPFIKKDEEENADGKNDLQSGKNSAV